jgi:hypothetical protein
MDPARLTETAPSADREARTAETPSATADPLLPMTDWLVVISFLIGVAIFGFISVLELVTNLFR